MTLSDGPHQILSICPLSAVIVGAGFAGLGMAIALKKRGINNFVVVEKAADLGGVWRDNNYPGAACDVPSHLYSFSFELKPDWSRVFAPQAEIHEYLRHCARKYKLLPHLQFGSEVRDAQFDERKSLWTVTLRNGSQLVSRLFIVATGQLGRPAIPRLPGIEEYRGHSFHSANWDHGFSLDGKRVAVIGTGASAIQFIPAIADRVDRLLVFQRSAAYILPRTDYAYSNIMKRLFRTVPWLMRLYRLGIYLEHESRKPAFTNRQWLMKYMAERPFRKLLDKQVKNKDLQARLVPDYPAGCKRILLSNQYLQTLSKPHVELITQDIRKLTANGIETTEGQHRLVDTIIYGTGFAASEFLAPMRINGVGNLDLNVAWQGGAQAHLGLTVPSFPNFFILYGPNTNLGHNSIVFMLESQILHVLRCINAMHKSQNDTIEVHNEAYVRFNLALQQRLTAAVWNNCQSWYINSSGRNSTNWPGFATSYRWLMKHGSLSVYKFSHSSDGIRGTR